MQEKEMECGGAVKRQSKHRGCGQEKETDCRGEAIKRNRLKVGCGQQKETECGSAASNRDKRERQNVEVRPLGTRERDRMWKCGH
jgi:hypothetical protein